MVSMPRDAMVLITTVGSGHGYKPRVQADQADLREIEGAIDGRKD